MFSHGGRPSFLYKWGAGAVLPLMLAIYAARIFVTKTAAIRAWKWRSTANAMEVCGEEALLYGLAVLFVALAAHFQCLWREVEKLEPFAEVLRNAMLICAGICAWRLFWRFANTYFLT